MDDVAHSVEPGPEWTCTRAVAHDDTVHLVILGCGRVGSRLAIVLEKRGHTVAVIDADADAFRRLGPGFTGRTITGNGFDRDVLTEAGITEADGFAAVSSGDNSNILAARVVREVFGVSDVVARIYDPDRAAVYERLGIPTVATVRWTADQILRRLLPDGAEPVWRDPTGAVLLIQVHANPAWVGQSITRMEAVAGCPLPFLQRLGTALVPDRAARFQDGDLVYAAVTRERVSEVESALAAEPEA